MLRSATICAVSSWLALAGAAAGADPPTNAAVPRATSEAPAANPEATAANADLPLAGPPPAAPASEGDTQPVKEVAIDPTAKPPVCRRYFPTGSRIATERCQSAEVDGSARSAEREQTRRDIDEMRMRQMAREQARAAAQAEALRQRAGF